MRLQTSNCSLLLIYLPRKDDRLSWIGWLPYSGWLTWLKWSPICCRSSAGQGKFVGQPTFYHCATQPTKYVNTDCTIFTFDGWAVTFGTAKRELGGLLPHPSPPCCTKCNSPPINGQCTNHQSLYDGPLLCGFNVAIKGLKLFTFIVVTVSIQVVTWTKEFLILFICQLVTAHRKQTHTADSH